jgi:hypothetical protein
MNNQLELPNKNIGTWKSVTVRLKEDELAVLNTKLDSNGFKTFSEFIHAWLRGQYSHHENNEQVEKLMQTKRDKGVKDPLTGQFNPTFYRNIDTKDMLRDLSTRYVYVKHAKDLVRYFERYAEIFFTKPQLIQSEPGHKRAWICDAMRKFGMYYDRKMHNPELRI